MYRTFGIYILVVFFVGCSLGTEQKIETAIKEIEEKKFEANGEKIRSLSIDSLKYERASMQNFYSDESDKQVNTLETYSDRLYTINDSSNPSTNKAIQAKAQKQLNVFKELQSLSLTADTTKNLYAVDYKLNAKTDKNSYQKRVRKYLYQDGLNEVQLDSRLKSEEF